MAFYDWNHNGKNDIQDDFIEYQIYKNVTDKKTGSNHSGSKVSNFDAAIGTIVFLLVFSLVFGGVKELLRDSEGTVSLIITFAIFIGAPLLFLWLLGKRSK